MKPSNSTSADLPASSAALKAKYHELGQVIASKQAEAAELAAAIPRIMATRIGDELAGAREKKRHAELEVELRNLQRTGEYLLDAYEAARQRELEAQWSKELGVATERGETLAAEMCATQALVDKLAEQMLKIRTLDEAFCLQLARTAALDQEHATSPRIVRADFDMRSLTSNMPRRVDLRMWANSNGQIQMSSIPTQLSPFELRGSGLIDLAAWASDYVSMGLQGLREPPKVSPSPPPAAA